MYRWIVDIWERINGSCFKLVNFEELRYVVLLRLWLIGIESMVVINKIKKVDYNIGRIFW